MPDNWLHKLLDSLTPHYARGRREVTREDHERGYVMIGEHKHRLSGERWVEWQL